jgi:phosphoenolpyruvate carboxykinase (GTP)
MGKTSLKNYVDALGNTLGKYVLTKFSHLKEQEGYKIHHSCLTFFKFIRKFGTKLIYKIYSRFCAPAENCPILDPNWEDPKGVKVEAILLGGRRPEGVPLVYEAFNWEHGVFLGATLKSEATAAAEHKTKAVMHDPFSMRPFFGYNFGDYLSHWLSFAGRKGLPKFFMVNWFRRSADGGFMWPGFGDNVRVLEWILKRCEGKEEGTAKVSAVGVIPTETALRLDGLDCEVDMEELFSTPKPYWAEEVAELRNYFRTQVGASLPEAITKQLDDLEKRIEAL